MWTYETIFLTNAYVLLHCLFICFICLFLCLNFITYFQFWDFDHYLDFVLLFWFLKCLLRSNKNNIILFLFIITAMKITLKNTRKTLRFVTAKEQFFSFREVTFFVIFICLLIYWFLFFQSVGVNDYFHFLNLYSKILCMLRVKSFFRLNQNFLCLK